MTIIALYSIKGGVGKTTTIAKLTAILSMQRKKRVGIISVNSYRIGAVDQLRAYAAIMGLPEGSPVFHAVLVHRDRGVPIQYAERFVNPAVAPVFLQQDFDRITPSEYLLKIAPVTEAEHVVEAMMPDPAVRKRLHMPAHEPCLVLHRTTWVGPAVATRNRFVYPAKRFRIGSRFRPLARNPIPASSTIRYGRTPMSAYSAKV